MHRNLPVSCLTVGGLNVNSLPAVLRSFNRMMLYITYRSLVECFNLLLVHGPNQLNLKFTDRVAE